MRRKSDRPVLSEGWARGNQIFIDGLTDFFYLTGTYAPRTHMHPHVRAMRAYRSYALDVRLRNLFCLVVGMTHLVPAEFAFPANFTCSSHCDHLTMNEIGS